MREETKDRRVKYTKSQLRASLVTLLKDKPLYKISIKEICDTADINRSTFYAHYETPYDLYEEVIWSASDDIMAIIDKHPKPRSARDHVNIFREILEYTEANRDFCLVLLSDKSNLTVGESLGTIFDVLRGNSFIAEENNSLPYELQSYTEIFVISGMTSIIWRWLNDENRISCDELANLICAIAFKGISGPSKLKNLMKLL